MNNPTTKKKRLKFAGFKPSAMQRIAQTMGYTGDMSGFDAYLNSNPDKQSKMEEYRQAATKLANWWVCTELCSRWYAFWCPCPHCFQE